MYRFACYRFEMVKLLLEQAIKHCGSQAKLADACGIKQSSIWQAKETDRCSARLAMAVERATDGKVTARQLRPDLPWPLQTEHAGGA
jgi:DNA-binding transcriptional regulator YdaS (Cro superfamily)